MASVRKLAAPTKPTLANTRRLRARPTRLANGAEIVPQNSEPKPPQNSGRIASRAASCWDSFQYCCRYVGSHVIPKYQGNERQPYCSHSNKTEREVSSLIHGTFPCPVARRSAPSSRASSEAFMLFCSRGLSRYQR